MPHLTPALARFAPAFDFPQSGSPGVINHRAFAEAGGISGIPSSVVDLGLSGLSKKVQGCRAFDFVMFNVVSVACFSSGCNYRSRLTDGEKGRALPTYIDISKPN